LNLTPLMPSEKAYRTRPKISVVIATFGTNSLLGNCLAALANQDWNFEDSLEVVIVNDGGKDYPPAAFDVYRKNLRIKYLRQDHRGPAAARNLGVKMAEGEIMVFLDDDSVPLRNWIESTILAWMDTPEYDGIGGCIAVDSKDNIYCRVNADIFNWYLKQPSPRGECLSLVTCNAGYKKSSLDKVRGFDDRFESACGEDRDLNLRIVRGGGKVRLDPTILVYHDRDVTLKSFVKKHYHYGVAASRIYSRFPDLKHFSAGVYGSLFSSIWRKREIWGNRAAALFLAAVSQLSTLIGFWVGKLHPEHKL
jgi:GT2 family glycosyltransferase